MSKKPFPSRVRWRAVWRNRWVILNLINQIAYGSRMDAVHVIKHYGGVAEYGRELHRAARECIEVRE